MRIALVANNKAPDSGRRLDDDDDDAVLRILAYRSVNNNVYVNFKIKLGRKPANCSPHADLAKSVSAPICIHNC